MSQKEVTRLEIISKIKDKRLTQRKGAELLVLSVRQVRRLVKAYKIHGAEGLISKHRGKKSNRAFNASTKETAVSLVSQKYSDFGPTLAAQKLRTEHEIKLSCETLRKWMLESGLYKLRKQRKLVVHQQRCRRERYGEMIQVDGSHHAWFEERGPKCCLLVYVDDATSKIQHLYFSKGEDRPSYFTATRKYIKDNGIPLSIYSDKDSVFRVPHKEAQSGTGETQFGRIARELGIQLICANSPQAKGRVERANRTLQDRLVKEMRLKGISTIEEANAFVPEFIENYNEMFGKEPQVQEDAHRKIVPSEAILDIIFTAQEHRLCSKNLEIRYKNKVYQLQVDKPSYRMRNAKVTVCDNLNGDIKILYRNKEIPYKVLDKGYSKAPVLPAKQIDFAISKARHIPAEDHPWRKYSPICKIYRARETEYTL